MLSKPYNVPNWVKGVCLYTYSNIRDEMKRSFPSVCLTWIPLWEMKWHVHCSFFRLTWIHIWGVKWNVVRPSVCHTWILIWGMKWRVVCPSCFGPIFWGEIKHSLLVCLSYLYPTKFVRLFVLCRSQYENGMKRRGWNVFFNLSVLYPIIGGGMKCNFFRLSVLLEP